MVAAFHADVHQLLPRVPVIDGGRARVQPIFIQDVADAIHKIALVRLQQGSNQSYDANNMFIHLTTFCNVL